MAYLRIKKIGGHKYGYLVSGSRKGGKVTQHIDQYLGRLDPSLNTNLKLAALVVQDNGTVSISVSRKLKGELILIEYKYKVLPSELKDDINELIRSGDK